MDKKKKNKINCNIEVYKLMLLKILSIEVLHLEYVYLS